ncbi:hypothetical protein Taro_043605, partial [Colocasia esculenta]|nr:hypothetical protein [Colocasia esculenta]
MKGRLDAFWKEGTEQVACSVRKTCYSVAKRAARCLAPGGLVCCQMSDARKCNSGQQGIRERTEQTLLGRKGLCPNRLGGVQRRLLGPAGTASPSTPVVPATGTTSTSTTRVAPSFPSSSPPEVESQHPATDEEGLQLPGRQPCWILGGKIDHSSASRYITTLVHAHIPGPVDAWREFPVPVRDLLFDMFM